MSRVGLRARLVAAFVGLAALTTLLAALMTTWGLHRTFDDYLERRSRDAVASAVMLAGEAHAQAGARWSAEALDDLAHELVLSGYDFRLTRDGRVLLDTTRLPRGSAPLELVERRLLVSPAGTRIGELAVYAQAPAGAAPADSALRGELDRVHLIAAALAGLVAIVLGGLVAGRLSRPLRRLAEAARGLGRGTATPALPTRGSPEVIEAADALRGLARDLDRQGSARKQLAQDLAHELRTPLTLMQGTIEAMQDGVVPFEPAGLEGLHTQVLRLTRLIDQIERLAEAEARPAPLRREPIALDRVAQDLVGALAAAFELQGLKVSTRLEPAGGLGDRDAVCQILANLLSNALKYAPAGSVVAISTEPHGADACVRVADEGPPPEHSARLFDRFYRSPREEGAMGAGLGLTIARDLAEAQGGRLELEDRTDSTCFVLRLPSPAPLPDAAPTGDGAGRAEAPLAPGG